MLTARMGRSRASLWTSRRCWKRPWKPARQPAKTRQAHRPTALLETSADAPMLQLLVPSLCVSLLDTLLEAYPAAATEELCKRFQASALALCRCTSHTWRHLAACCAVHRRMVEILGAVVQMEWFALVFDRVSFRSEVVGCMASPGPHATDDDLSDAAQDAGCGGFDATLTHAQSADLGAFDACLTHLLHLSKRHRPACGFISLYGRAESLVRQVASHAARSLGRHPLCLTSSGCVPSTTLRLGSVFPSSWMRSRTSCRSGLSRFRSAGSCRQGAA